MIELLEAHGNTNGHVSGASGCEHSECCWMKIRERGEILEQQTRPEDISP